MTLLDKSATRSPLAEAVLICEIAGEQRAFRAVCPHMGGPLADGRLESGILHCPWHRFRYDAASGAGLGLAGLLGLCLEPAPLPDDLSAAVVLQESAASPPVLNGSS